MFTILQIQAQLSTLISKCDILGTVSNNRHPLRLKRNYEATAKIFSLLYQPTKTNHQSMKFLMWHSNHFTDIWSKINLFFTSQNGISILSKISRIKVLRWNSFWRYWQHLATTGERDVSVWNVVQFWVSPLDCGLYYWILYRGITLLLFWGCRHSYCVHKLGTLVHSTNHTTSLKFEW